MAEQQTPFSPPHASRPPWTHDLAALSFLQMLSQGPGGVQSLSSTSDGFITTPQSPLPAVFTSMRDASSSASDQASTPFPSIDLADLDNLLGSPTEEEEQEQQESSHHHHHHHPLASASPQDDLHGPVLAQLRTASISRHESGASSHSEIGPLPVSSSSMMMMTGGLAGSRRMVGLTTAPNRTSPSPRDRPRQLMLSEIGKSRSFTHAPARHMADPYSPSTPPSIRRSMSTEQVFMQQPHHTLQPEHQLDDDGASSHGGSACDVSRLVCVNDTHVISLFS